MDSRFEPRGFLPEPDPLTRFGDDSEFAMLDELGRDLPSLLRDPGFRAFARGLKLPSLPARDPELPTLRLYYIRLGFLASAYVNQVGQEPATILPRNLAAPLCDACARLGRPPILSYDGYALANWKRFDPNGPIALGNIHTIQKYLHLHDEHSFILVHVQIEAEAAVLLAAVGRIEEALARGDDAAISAALAEVARTIWAMAAILRRIPEQMDPALYYWTFRPYIRFFEGVVYEGVEHAPMSFRGETGAQSSIVPLLVALLKVPHRPSELTNHLAEMRRFMPAEHRALIERVEALPDLRGRGDRAPYNEALEALATFREIHLGFAYEYIARWVTDPRGTGGTPYLEWLGQLIAETRAHKIA
jgi:indoleamine 2,3-dioxygenase